MSFEILFEDEYFLAANKPPGLPSQPTVDKRRPSFFNELKKQLQNERGADFYLALHHRLDRDTSGVMIFAKNKSANEPLANLFKKHQIQKTYHCLTKLKNVPETWDIKNFLAEIRDPKIKKTKMVSVHSGGQPAHTKFKKLQILSGGLLIQAQPLSGRMHQIRVHLSEKDLGIFGDDIYPAPAKPKPTRLMLHASKLEFKHPFTQAEMIIECPWPQDFADFYQLIF